MTHALYLLDPEPTAQWAPFAGARPVCELRAGAHLIRERWEAFVGSEAAGIFALPHLAGFVEPGVPAVLPRRAVTGPAVIGSSTFAPQGEAWDAAVKRWRELSTDDGAKFDRTVTLDAGALAPMITYGTNPGMGIPVTGRVPSAGPADSPAWISDSELETICPERKKRVTGPGRRCATTR